MSISKVIVMAVHLIDEGDLEGLQKMYDVVREVSNQHPQAIIITEVIKKIVSDFSPENAIYLLTHNDQLGKYMDAINDDQRR